MLLTGYSNAKGRVYASFCLYCYQGDITYINRDTKDAEGKFQELWIEGDKFYRINLILIILKKLNRCLRKYRHE